MAENSKIEWTDHTFNPWVGCQKVAAGCEHCKKTSDSYWRQPVKWDAAAKGGERQRVFCASLADVFEDWGSLDNLRLELFALIDATPHLDWLLLTKRPENIQRMWLPRGAADDVCGGSDGQTWCSFRPNVWLGTSVATQEDVDQNIPVLLRCRDLAPVLFVSAEPLLGSISLCLNSTGWQHIDEIGAEPPPDGDPWLKQIDWLIVGGESGHGARPMHPDWARSLRDQCVTAKVPFFFKQWGEWAVGDVIPGGDLGGDMRRGVADIVHRDYHDPDELLRRSFFRGDVIMRRIGKKAAGRLLDGREWNEFPNAVQQEHNR